MEPTNSGPVYYFNESWEYDGDDLNPNHLYQIYSEDLDIPPHKTYLYQNKVWQPMGYFRVFYDDTTIQEMINDGELIYNPHINMYNDVADPNGLGFEFSIVHDLGEVIPQ